jgi:hypothetical protein
LEKVRTTMATSRAAETTQKRDYRLERVRTTMATSRERQRPPNNVVNDLRRKGSE